MNPGEHPSDDALDPIERFSRSIERFLHLESSAGVMLLAATVGAMVIKNSALTDLYIAYLNIEGEVRVGALAVQKPLFLWVNDGWMAIFFFLVGLEIKHEILHGHLADRRQLVLPTAGAIGGVAIPAAIYAALNWQDPVALKGWAVPTATDIAFALGVLAAVGSRVPVALKVFLMTLAILDDLIAIVIIALVYTSGLSVTSLAAGAAVLALMTILKLCGIRTTTPYIMLGAALWVCVLKSGVHATLAGVATAFFISAAPTAEHPESPLKALLDDLHPWVAFFILPMFAFVNAGIALEGLKLSSLLDPVPLGIALGLLLGKPIGVMACVGLAIVTGLARLPQGVTWLHLFGVALLCGVGFTMSLFVGGLAFAEGGAGYARIDRLGVLVGSGLSAVAGFAVLRLAVGRSST